MDLPPRQRAGAYEFPSYLRLQKAVRWAEASHVKVFLLGGGQLFAIGVLLLSGHFFTGRRTFYFLLVDQAHSIMYSIEYVPVLSLQLPESTTADT